MAVGFNLPDPYEAQKADIARRQKYAEILQRTFIRDYQPRFAARGIDATPAWGARMTLGGT